MKKLILFLLLILCGVQAQFAQTNLWGMTSAGGSGAGVIFKTNADGTNEQVMYDFPISPGSNPYYSSLTAYGTKFYGLTYLGGTNNLGILFEYDPSTGFITKKIDFSGALNGGYPYGSLTTSGTKLYGMTGGGGTKNSGTLFEYDPSNGVITKKFDFDSVRGGLPYGSLIASGTKLYGMTNQGGVKNMGTLFEYDPSTASLTKKFDFDSTNGSYPRGSLTATGTKLYGLTSFGGTKDMGTLFEYDLSTAVLTKKFDFDSIKGNNPTSSLLASGTKLYGMTWGGGTKDMGTLFEYDPSAGILTKKTDFNGPNGINPWGSLIVSGTKLYGMTWGGGTNNLGTLFEYDTLTAGLTKKIDFNGLSNGSNPFGSLMVSGTKLYGMTNAGGTNGLGILLEYDLSTGALIKKIDFGGMPNGSSPYGSLIASGTKFYGMTYTSGPNNLGTLFEYDPSTGIFTKKIDFNGTSNGSNPTGSLILSGTKLYGMTSTGGTNGYGTLFEYDPSTGNLTKKVDFDSINNGGTPIGSLIGSLISSENKLYGMTAVGGTGKFGTLFEYNPSNGVLTTKINFIGSNGSFPQSSLYPSGTKLYGMTVQGGANDLGTLFEYDPSTGALVKRIDFNNIPMGSYPFSSLIGLGTKLYGMTSKGGASNVGTLFEYDPSSGLLTKKIDFNGTNGSVPYSSLTVSGTKLYGMTSTGGVNNTGILFEYDPSTGGGFTKKTDFNGTNGQTPGYTQLLVYPAAQTGISSVTRDAFNVSVFPNPFNAGTFIYADDEAAFVKITVTNLNGVSVYENDKVPAKENFRLEGTFAQGVYFVNIITSKGMVTKKLVKF